MTLSKIDFPLVEPQHVLSNCYSCQKTTEILVEAWRLAFCKVHLCTWYFRGKPFRGREKCKIGGREGDVGHLWGHT